ncbi:deoxyribose-phosphate aldolase [Gloeomargarita lithophora Alchichica-D10]|uniref:Deoxyribose-phosphate aldolase n=1 Tax=Gloeomargarita lithophora Alchichica-D10 TaxID=1188229 RepID=A0A1J0AHA9_9CYAN|nr:deoxyribose-phosphate aldolase [Gloeomargarita lithophora]APB35332.1 deoxyribose-phosphate aldolase [Gloeomargarita lithophora Alchichica-D10]
MHSSLPDIATVIEHALLQPGITSPEINQGCQDADRYGFPVVCVYPSAVQQCNELLHQRPCRVCAVIGFPSGATTPAVKYYEAMEAVESGAQELDVVINLGWLKEGKTQAVYKEIAQIVSETKQTIKAILEMNLLTQAEQKLAAEICLDAGIHYLKTGTGWLGGATVEQVKLLQKISNNRVGIKASGGIKTIEQAQELLLAGATRIGTSRGIDLVKQQAELTT